MKIKDTARRGRRQELSLNDASWTDGHFEAEVNWWDDLYDDHDVFSIIMQERVELVLRWVDSLHLPPHSRILDLGCGTGRTVVELRKRNFRVDGVDRVFDMVARARENVVKAGVASSTGLLTMDAHQLGIQDDSYALVIAIGLITWLSLPQFALHEMARVVQPGGHLILIDGNSIRLPYLLDPLNNPSRFLKPLKKAAKQVSQSIRPGSIERLDVTLRRQHEFDAMLSAVGLEKKATIGLGFGPFTFFGRKLLPDSLGVRLNRNLNRLAERNVPVLQSFAAEYIVLSRKPGRVQVSNSLDNGRHSSSGVEMASAARADQPSANGGSAPNGLSPHWNRGSDLGQAPDEQPRRAQSHTRRSSSAQLD